MCEGREVGITPDHAIYSLGRGFRAVSVSVPLDHADGVPYPWIDLVLISVHQLLFAEQ